MQLVSKIEMGQKWEVMAYFYLLYEDLNLLDENNIELIIPYILNVLSESCKESKELSNYVHSRFFNVFGIHLYTEEIKKEFLQLCLTVINWSGGKEDFLYYQAYDQLINSVSEIEKKAIKNYILKNVSKYTSDSFYKGYNDGDFLPF